jgi:hypothetical protein
MIRLPRIALVAVVLCLGASEAAALPFLDPVVRTRTGSGSIPIFSVPFFFDFGAFPDDPDGLSDPDCFSGVTANFGHGIPDGVPMVSCDFQNLTGQPITLLDFVFSPPDPSPDLFQIFDDGGFFGMGGLDITNAGAQFALSGDNLGIPPCVFVIESCVGGEFGIDLVGFTTGTNISMTASDPAVPEPATLTMLGAGLVLAAAGYRRRRRQG